MSVNFFFLVFLIGTLYLGNWTVPFTVRKVFFGENVKSCTIAVKRKTFLRNIRNLLFVEIELGHIFFCCLFKYAMVLSMKEINTAKTPSEKNISNFGTAKKSEKTPSQHHHQNCTRRSGMGSPSSQTEVSHNFFSLFPVFHD